MNYHSQISLLSKYVPGSENKGKVNKVLILFKLSSSASRENAIAAQDLLLQSDQTKRTAPILTSIVPYYPRAVRVHYWPTVPLRG